MIDLKKIESMYLEIKDPANQDTPKQFGLIEGLMNYIPSLVAEVGVRQAENARLRGALDQIHHYGSHIDLDNTAQRMRSIARKALEQSGV